MRGLGNPRIYPLLVLYRIPPKAASRPFAGRTPPPLPYSQTPRTPALAPAWPTAVLPPPRPPPQFRRTSCVFTFFYFLSNSDETLDLCFPPGLCLSSPATYFNNTLQLPQLAHLFTHLSIDLLSRPTTHPPTHLSIFPIAYLSIYPCTHPSIHPLIHSSIHPLIPPSIHPPTHSPTHPSTHPIIPTARTKSSSLRASLVSSTRTECDKQSNRQ